jgi:hypothetical protein
VSGVRNDEQGYWHLAPDTRHTGMNKYGIFFKAILWAILFIPPINHIFPLFTKKQRITSQRMAPFRTKIVKFFGYIKLSKLRYLVEIIRYHPSKTAVLIFVRFLHDIFGTMKKNT